MKKGLFVLLLFGSLSLQSCETETTELVGHAKIVAVDEFQNPMSGVIVTFSSPVNIIMDTGVTNLSGYYIYDHPYPTAEIYQVDCYTPDSVYHGSGIIRVKPDTTIELVIPLYEL